MSAVQTPSGELHDHAYAEEAFKTIFMRSPEAIALLRLRDRMVLEVNDELLELTGYTRSQLVGRTSLDIGLWPDEQERQRILGFLLRGQRIVDEETVLYMADRMPRLIRLNGCMVHLAGEDCTLFYFRDVTAESLANEGLRAGEYALAQANEKLNRQIKLHTVTEAMAHMGHWVCYPGDPKVHVSAGYGPLHGVGLIQEVPVGEHIRNIVEEDRAAYKQALKRMDGEPLDCRYRRPDGTVVWLRSRIHRQIEHGVHKADFGIVQDVTAEHETLGQLGDKLAFIQRVTSRSPGMTFEYYEATGDGARFLFVSAAVQSLFGVNEAQALANPRSIFDPIHPDDFSSLRAVAREASASSTAFQFEVRLRAQGSAQRWVLVDAVPQVLASGGTLWCGSAIEITSHKATIAKLQESETRFRALTELTSDWYWEQDENMRFVRIDGNTPSGMPIQDAGYIGKTRWDAGPQGLTPEQWDAHRAQLAAREIFHDFELQRLRPDGVVTWVAVSGAPMLDADGKFKGYRGTGRNIDARKKAEADIERLAFFDALTGLPNRRLLLDRLNQSVAARARHHTHGALLFIDLDNFKVLNDTMGHQMGDVLLQQVAARLADCVRAIDTVARLGGDEFVVMLEELNHDATDAAAHAELVAKKILNSLNTPYQLGGQVHHSSPSIGVALFSEHQSVDEMLKRADLAMYQAKAAGRNTVRFFDPVMQAAATARAVLEADLRKGLLRREFVLYYQPVVDADRHTIGVEALVRWRHPQRGMVSPAEFIPVAEQAGLILPLGQWVLETACEQLVAWNNSPATRQLTMAVNVSARQFRHPEFSAQLLALLRLSGANPYRLKLELTESLLLTDIEDAIAKMTELRSIGVSFALDDFGTGYSSLSYLKRLPLDLLKIDQSFVRDVLTDPNDAAIARTVLSLAHSLELGVVAEGVESEGQRDFLLAAGCKAFQGYLFGRPVPVEQLQLSAGANFDVKPAVG